jgi:hypothetical protein
MLRNNHGIAVDGVAPDCGWHSYLGVLVMAVSPPADPPGAQALLTS